MPGFLDDDEWLSVEFDQRTLDRFDSLDRLGGDADDIWDNAGSVRYFAPVGCTISLNDFPRYSDSWPGDDTVLLRGTGRFEEIHDLNNVPVHRPSDEVWPVWPVPAGADGVVVDIDDDVEGVTFYHDVVFDGQHASRHDCESYYGTSIGVSWDLDANDSYEAAGTSVSFDAQTLDGPRTVVARARAQHPTDPTTIGQGLPVDVPVLIRNVAPQIGTFAATDSLGLDVTDGSRVAIAGLPVTFDADFTAPGRPDRQTASIDWGDGAVSSVFDEFRDAYGGAVGRIRATHVFAPGTHIVRVSVTDDDGGTSDRTIEVDVVSLADAIRAVADELAGQAATADPASARLLESALDELIGNQDGRSTNGALDELDDDPISAITKLSAAIEFVLAAEESSGQDFSSLWTLLGLSAEAVASSARADAVAAIPTPSPGQRRTLATISGLISSGHLDLLAGAPVAACEDFRQATAKAIRLV